MIKKCLFFGALVLSLNALPLFSSYSMSKPQKQSGHGIDVYPKVCRHGLTIGPHKQFAVFVFCDDAYGTTIGIVNYSPGLLTRETSYDEATIKEMIKTWSLESRFWQEASWARDVTSFEWSKDGLSLFVTTSPIYGTGKKFTLDLVRKKIISETPIN